MSTRRVTAPTLRPVLIIGATTVILVVALLVGVRIFMPPPSLVPLPEEPAPTVSREPVIDDEAAALLACEVFDPQQRERAQDWIDTHAEDEAAPVVAELRAREQATRDRVKALRGRLLVYDAAVPVTPAMRHDLAELSRLTNPGDLEVTRWQAKDERVARLSAQLAQVDTSTLCDERTRQAYRDLVTLVGPDLPRLRELARWFDRLDRTRDARAVLAALDYAAPIPPDVDTHLATVARELGEDWYRLPQWRDKLARVAALRTRLAGLEEAFVCSAEHRRAFDELAELIGDEHELVQAAQARIAELDGPGAPPWATSSGRDRYGLWADLVIERTSQRFRYLPPGTVHLGSPTEEAHRDEDETPLSVRLDRGFWISTTETTQALWDTIFDQPVTRFRNPEFPIHSLSWEQARGFCAALARRLPGAWVRLPSEAEWEYACRAGQRGAFIGPDGPVDRYDHLAIEDLAWSDRNSDGRPHVVAMRAPNPLGLYDLHGNVWEWCADAYVPYPRGHLVDWVGVRMDADPIARSLRGGSFADPPHKLRAANRHGLASDRASVYVGLRLVIDCEPRDPEPDTPAPAPESSDLPNTPIAANESENKDDEDAP